MNPGPRDGIKTQIERSAKAWIPDSYPLDNIVFSWARLGYFGPLEPLSFVSSPGFDDGVNVGRHGLCSARDT